MSEREDGGPAFPKFGMNAWDRPQTLDAGMSLRDWFAGRALHVVYDNGGRYSEAGLKEVAAQSYAVADAMLAARKEPPHDRDTDAKAVAERLKERVRTYDRLHSVEFCGGSLGSLRSDLREAAAAIDRLIAERDAKDAEIFITECLLSEERNMRFEAERELAEAKARIGELETKARGADAVVTAIERAIPDWRSYRDLVDAVECKMAGERS